MTERRWRPRVHWACTIAHRMMKVPPDELPREIIDTLTEMVDACTVIGWEFKSQETIALIVVMHREYKRGWVTTRSAESSRLYFHSLAGHVHRTTSAGRSV